MKKVILLLFAFALLAGAIISTNIVSNAGSLDQTIIIAQAEDDDYSDSESFNFDEGNYGDEDYSEGSSGGDSYTEDNYEDHEEEEDFDYDSDFDFNDVEE